MVLIRFLPGWRVEGGRSHHSVISGAPLGTPLDIERQRQSVKERVYLTASGCSALSAGEMHTYCSDLETLVLCTQSVRYALNLADGHYMDRKFRQLFGRPFID